MGWIVGAAVAVAAFLILKISGKTNIVQSALFAFFLFCVTLFCFDEKIVYRETAQIAPEVFLLIDRSLSCQTQETNLAGKLGASIEPAKVYYFGENIARRPEDVVGMKTAVWDAIAALETAIPEDGRIVVISDFRDNASRNPFSSNRNVKYVAMGKGRTARTMPTDFGIPEFCQSGESVSVSFSVFGAEDSEFRWEVRLNSRTVASGVKKTTRGENRFTEKIPVYGEGYAEAELRIRTEAGDESVQSRMIHCLPENYRILIAAGRPSEELAFVRRFAEGLKWIKVDTAVAKRPGEKIKLSDLDRFSGLFLMDIADTQIDGIERLKEWRKPIFYQPGLRNFDEIRGLMSLFTNARIPNRFSVTGFEQKGRNTAIRTAFAGTDPVIATSRNRKAFLGWETWKWDFAGMALDADWNYFDDFWRDTIRFLTQSRESTPPISRLNYMTGEKTPRGFRSEGFYSVETNGVTARFCVYANAAESEEIPPDVSGISNAVFLEDITNAEAFIAEVRGTDRKMSVRQTTIELRKEIWFLLAMFVSLTVFWFLKDLKEIRR